MAYDNVLKELCESVKFPTEIEIPLLKEQTTEFSVHFREKLNKRFADDAAKVNQLTWRELEIGNMTGNELLRAMIKICRTPEWISMGNCVLMTVAGNAAVTLCRLKKKNFEVIGTLDSAAVETMYFKLFNETFCSAERNGGYAKHYKENEIKKMRDEAPRQLQKFMDESIKQFPNSGYRRAFIGLIAEIAKVETVDAAERKFPGSIPVAACVYLAVDKDICGDLQDMFGQSKLLPFTEWKIECRTQHPSCTEQELFLFYHQKKFELRRKKAISIVKRSGINENNVHDAIGCIREFYGLNGE